jgi:hypothetical protein
VSFWNVYDRKDISSYFWNGIEDEQDISHQWILLPVSGIKYEF